MAWKQCLMHCKVSSHSRIFTYGIIIGIFASIQSFLYVAAACSLQVTTGKGCFLEDSVTGNVYDLSPLAKGTGGKDYFTVTTKSSDEYYIKVIYLKGSGNIFFYFLV